MFVEAIIIPPLFFIFVIIGSSVKEIELSYSLIPPV